MMVPPRSGSARPALPAGMPHEPGGRAPAGRQRSKRPSRPAGRSGRRALPADLLIYVTSVTVLVYVWRIQDLQPILAALQVPSLISLAALGLYIIDQDRRRALRPILRQPIVRAVIAIMALAVASVPTSVHDGHSFRFIMNDLSKNFVLMLIIAASVRGFADLRSYVLAMLFGAFWYAQFIYFNVEVGISGRLGDLVYYDANDLGMLMVCSIPMALFFLLRGQNIFVRLFALLCLPLFLVVIIKTGSRGAFLGMITVCLYLLFFFKSVSRKVRLIAVAAGVIGLLTLGGDQYWALMRTLLNPKEDYNWSGQSETGRMDVWKRGIGYMMHNPITGVGVDAFPIAEGTLSEQATLQAYGVGFKWSAAHNSFVQIGAELGILGLAAFCTALFFCYRGTRSIRAGPSRRAPDEQVLAEALGGALVGYMITGFFLSQAYGAFTFVLYGLIAALVKTASVNEIVAVPTSRPVPQRRVAIPPAGGRIR